MKRDLSLFERQRFSFFSFYSPQIMQSINFDWSYLAICKFSAGARFSKVPITFRSRKLFYACHVCIQDQSFNISFKKLVNEEKLASLWARDFVTIQQIMISKFAFGPERLPSLSRNGPLVVTYGYAETRTMASSWDGKYSVDGTRGTAKHINSRRGLFSLTSH